MLLHGLFSFQLMGTGAARVYAELCRLTARLSAAASANRTKPPRLKSEKLNIIT